MSVLGIPPRTRELGGVCAARASDDEGLSSDGERGGDERFDDYFGGIGAEDALGDGEFGGGPWSGEGPYAYGGVD